MESVLNRRESLRVIAGTAAALLVGKNFTGHLRAEESASGASHVALVPEAEQGPFYIDAERLRRDIREGKPGVPLQLRIALVDSNSGRPLPKAAVDIWHCDAGGVYSGFTKMKMGPPPDHDDDDFDDMDFGPPQGAPGGQRGPGGLNKPTDGTSFLRGVQLTDEEGVAVFDTIYPGWYEGREIHIHLKVHLDGAVTKSTYAGGHVCHTGQLFFPDTTNGTVSRLQPYALSKIPRTTKATDHVYRDQNGDKTVMVIHPVAADASRGYFASITLGLDPLASPQPVGFH